MNHAPVELAALPEFLQAQRWFAGKAEPIKDVMVIDHVQLPADCTLAIVEVRYGLAQPERYLLPVRTGSRGQVKEALDRPECARALLELVRQGQNVPTSAGAVRGSVVPGAEPTLKALGPEPSARTLGVEQSNTSLVFGDRVIFKIIRKLEGGVSPELEVGRFLATRTSFRDTPALLGALELEGPAASTLGLLHAFVANAIDGWRHALGRLEIGRVDGAFAEELSALGATIGRLHAALASDREDPAFSPEPLLLEDLQRWSSSIIGELGVTLSLAEPRFPELAEQRERLLQKAQRIARLTPSGVRIRQHGDLHLGQVLRSDGGWKVIDFEGEPVRATSARREKYTPLKDVAGMLRSFAYAAASAGLEGKPRRDAVRAMRRSFLDGYQSVPEAAALLPESDETTRVLLEGLELDKVLYEVRYELQMRPDWVHIPVESLLPQEDT